MKIQEPTIVLNHVQVTELFRDNRNLQHSFLKWIILALESKDKQEHANDDIEKELEVLKREILEIQMAGMIHQNVYNESLDLLSQCNTYRQTQDSNIRDCVFDRVFKSLDMEVNSAENILFYVNQLTISQRLVIRFMVHQFIQAQVAFIRTTSKAQQYTKRSELEGYHCTTNPYYSDLEKTSTKLKDEIDSKESLIAKLSQELQEIKVQMVQQQQGLENAKKILDEQIEQNSKISNEKEQLKEHFKSEHVHMQNELERIRREVESARNEAVIYQAQLGSAINIRWSDDTFNNPIQLTKEIEKLCQK
ncbi:10305_t:CDS:1, partial [Dentiscutata heterogama]